MSFELSPWPGVETFGKRPEGLITNAIKSAGVYDLCLSHVATSYITFAAVLALFASTVLSFP